MKPRTGSIGRDTLAAARLSTIVTGQAHQNQVLTADELRTISGGAGRPGPNNRGGSHRPSQFRKSKALKIQRNPPGEMGDRRLSPERRHLSAAELGAIVGAGRPGPNNTGSGSSSSQFRKYKALEIQRNLPPAIGDGRLSSEQRRLTAAELRAIVGSGRQRSQTTGSGSSSGI